MTATILLCDASHTESDPEARLRVRELLPREVGGCDHELAAFAPRHRRLERVPAVDPLALALVLFWPVLAEDVLGGDSEELEGVGRVREVGGVGPVLRGGLGVRFRGGDEGQVGEVRRVGDRQAS